MSDQEILKEDIFCLNFELTALAEMVLKNESERMLPGFCSDLIEHDHKERYNLACQYSEGRKVLDFACGVGYGSNLLATKGNAKSVMGCDLDASAIRYAKHKYKTDNLLFSCKNAETYVNENQFDLVISFETIEHLPNYKFFIDNVYKNLVDGGIFIVSTPISSLEIDNNPINPYHVQEWGFDAFQKEISNVFTVKTIYTQLYQNGFLNDQILLEYNQRKESLKQQIKNKIKSKLRGTYIGPAYVNDWYHPRNYSVIEEYQGQYNSEDLGQKYIGYQILVCVKNES